MELIKDTNSIKKSNYLMFNKTYKNKSKKKQSLEILKRTEFCKVSKASNEIMLDRFYKGKRIEFPFN